MPKILALYAANNAERTGTPLRDETRWKEFKMGSNFGIVADPFVVLNEADEVKSSVILSAMIRKKNVSFVILDFRRQDDF